MTYTGISATILYKLDKAKRMMFSRWLKELPFLKTRAKCADYGKNETMDTLWQKLPKISKEYWLLRAA